MSIFNIQMRRHMGSYYYRVRSEKRDLFSLNADAQPRGEVKVKIEDDVMRAIQRAVIGHATTAWSPQAKRDGEMHQGFSVSF